MQTDRAVHAGLPDKHHEKQDGRFQEIFFLGLFLPGKLKDGGMEISRTLELRCKSQFCHFLAKRPLTSCLIYSVSSSVEQGYEYLHINW